MGQNDAVYDHLFEGKPLKCVITMEDFRMPVCIMKKKPTLEADGMPSYSGYKKTYEAKALMEALRKTWGEYSLKLAESYLSESDPMNKSLAEEFVLVPNRLLWNPKSDYTQIPSLPERQKAPSFDEKKLVGFSQTGVVDVGDGSLEQNGTLKRFLKNGIFNGINALDWMISSHAKHYQFVNCQFTDCVFKKVCWCSVRYTACQFIRCTFVDCDPKNGYSHTMLNNEYQQCVVVNYSEQTTTFNSKLIGTQTEGQTAANKANEEIQVLNANKKINNPKSN